ncbi:hypothetical protein LOD99_11016 [Oopsacas minuta]|uniref:Uncharacterized protein n=1 Tax=Oopsacas minuta TaxID=111878 RepID=A0AAV7KCT2_9METZ|nr:hypothetical protein LOD99_11016 [Oopsacas minuta]
MRSRTFKWLPTSRVIKDSMKFTREFLCEKTGLRIDQPSSDGGTTSTGNMARQCFLIKNNFIYWVSTLISEDMREPINSLHSNLSVLLSIFNCTHAVDTDKLNSLCRDTYESILSNFPWVNVTPSLNRLLAHFTELIRDCNGGFGLKNFSEEAVEAYNKLIRKYREHLVRKISLTTNSRDIFARLLSQSDPVLIGFRNVLKCKECGGIGHTCRLKCTNLLHQTIDQDILFNSLIFG